jgi:ABC-type sulfate/molybdate transport systems ATPase subunit
MGFADEVIHLTAGEIQRIATSSEMYYQPENEQQGALMGMINVLNTEDGELLFRPAEYTLTDANIAVKYESHFDTGIVVFNYFTTELNERIVLSSRYPLTKVDKIRIQKHS